MIKWFKKFYTFLLSWFCSTKYKHIGSLYLFFGGFSGIIIFLISIGFFLNKYQNWERVTENDNVKVEEMYNGYDNSFIFNYKYKKVVTTYNEENNTSSDIEIYFSNIGDEIDILSSFFLLIENISNIFL